MQFKLLTAVTTFLAASSVQAAIAPADIVNTLEKVTDLSSDTKDIAEDISNPITIIPNGFKLVNNFKDIISTVVDANSMLGDLPNDPNFPEAGQTDICNAFRDFVKVHQELLKVVIGKESLLGRTPVASVIAAVLRSLENVVDKVAFTIIDTVPTCAAGAKKDLDALDGTIGEAIDTFSR